MLLKHVIDPCAESLMDGRPHLVG